MATNKRGLFARISLDYADHPKIADLSDAAFRAHVTFILYARKYQTDGVIKNRVANRLASQWDTDVLTELSSNDETSPSLVILDNGDYLLHDYAEMQETKAEIDALKARNSANGAKGGRPKTKSKTQSVSESVTKSQTDLGTQTKAELEGELEGELEVNKTPPSPPRGEARKRATRLPDGWEPDRSVVEAMRAKYPNVDLRSEHDKFCDYWRAKSGKDATKLDWNATWRNWIRNAEKYAATVGGSRPNTYEAWSTPAGEPIASELPTFDDVIDGEIVQFRRAVS